MGAFGRVRAPASLVIALCLLAGPAAAGDPDTSGRVRITRLREDEANRLQAIEKSLQSGARRVVSIRPRESDPARFDVTLYDYATEQAQELVVDAKGVELARRVVADVPPLAQGELDDAMKIVRAAPEFREGLQQGTHRLYAPMPPITTGKDGRRLVNVGILRPTGFLLAAENEIVSVHLPTGTITRYPDGAPETGLATSVVCGPPELPCGAAVGACGAVEHYEWPAPNPVWKLDVLHPKCTQSVQPSGTGLEIRNVFYRDHLVLERASVPVLNVRYAGDACGPYRDWLFAENCFEASGTTVSPGVVVTDGTPPRTFCETGSDAGTFKGVAIHDEGNALRLVSEMDAGHYRYIMEWRLGLDGTLQPIFGFGATSDSCTCNTHYHHAYWRFEFALDGTPGNFATGINTLERRLPGFPVQWSAIPREALFQRPASGWTEDWWRIRNPATGAEYVLKPGLEDGSSVGDDYARGDVWALAYNPNEIDDLNINTTIRMEPWLTNEVLGGSKRLVLWYRAGFSHEWEPSGTEVCHLVGPTLEPPQVCPAAVTLDRNLYGCASPVVATVVDPDLAGAGSLTVTARSGAEGAPETVTLTESPAQSGRFSGSIATWAGAAASGDGKLSVAEHDTITLAYVDVASCGNANVPVETTASVDCAPPVISDVAASLVTEVSAVVTFATDEQANSSLAYGPVPPPSTLVEDLASYRTNHTIPLQDLVPCTTYSYAVTSSDALGNRATDANGGAYHAFTTAGRGYALGPDDVESGIAGWQTSGPTGSVWHLDTCRSASATHAWKAGASTCPGFYGHGADTYLTSPVLALVGAGHGHHLRYREFYKTEANHDFCRPQISVDGGTTWTTLAQYSGASVTWLLRDIDLAAYTGSSVKVRFWFHTDLSGTDEGWYLDDFDVSRQASCGASLAHVSHTVSDSCGVGGAGNGTLDPGERGVVGITARNGGLGGATGVHVELQTTTPGVTILDSVADLPDIAAGATGSTAPPGVSFATSADVPCGTAIAFTARFTADQGSWTDAFSVPVGGTGATTTSTWNASDVPRPIPDFPAPPAVSTIAIADPGTVVDVDVGVTLQHTYDGDVDLFLVGPNGTRVELSTDNGSGGDNYTGTIFDDEATRSIVTGTAPFTGSYQPETALSALDGIPAAGTWNLEITDDGSADSGMLQSWYVRLTSRAPACTPCTTIAPSAEVSGVTWPGRSDVSWSAVAGAEWYELYRGSDADQPALLTGSVDSCLRASPNTTAQGGLDEAPPQASFFWYLVLAANDGGSGPAGPASAGPRIVDAQGSCP